MNDVTQLIQAINQQIDHFIFDGYHAMLSTFATTLTVLLVVYFAGLGWMVLRGLVPLSPMALGWHMFKAAIILGLILNWNYFAFFIVQTLLHGPDQFIGAIVQAQHTGNTAATLTDGLAKFWQTGTNVFADVWRQSGSNFLLGTLMGLLGFITVLGITSIVLFYIIMAKVLLSLLLIAAPLLLPMYLWNATREAFNGWIRLLAQWMITPIFVYALLGIFINLLQTQISAMAENNAEPTTASISAFALMGIIIIAAFKQAGNIGRELSRKIALPEWSAVTENQLIPTIAFKALRE